MSVADDLLKAADIMEDRGHATGTAINHTGKVCALGAIGLATIPHFERYSDGYMYVLRREPRASEAVYAFAMHVGHSSYYGDVIDTVWKFNDGTRGRGAQKKVVKAFRAAAAQIKEAELAAELARTTELCSQVCPDSFPLPKVDVTPNPVDRRPVNSPDSQHRPTETVPTPPRLAALVGAT